MIIVTFTYVCDQCHQTIIETEEGSAYSEYMPSTRPGWRFARHKAMHSIEVEVCPDCQTKLHQAYELYD